MKRLFFISLFIFVWVCSFLEDGFCSQYTGGIGDGWYALESTDFSLGGPNVSLSSSAGQIFTVGQTTTAISSKTITDSTGGSITSLNDIRVRIPSGFNMEWYTQDATASVSGTASGKVSTTVSYAGSNKILVLDVTSNFSSGEYITLGGLSFTNFSVVSDSDNLELDIYNSGNPYATDNKYIQVKAAASAPFLGGSGDGWGAAGSSDISPLLAKPGAAIAYWRLDEGAGITMYDDTTSDNDGTLSLGSLGNTALGNAWVNGKFGKALSFDGTDDSVSVDDATSLDLSEGITVSAWVKPASVSGTNHEVLQKSGAYGLKMTSDGKFIGYRWGGPENHLSTTTAQAGNWYFVAMTYDKTQHKIYVNGVLENQEADTISIPASANSISIGGAANKFPGIIDDMKIYSYARTADELMIDYSHGAAYLGAGTKGAACAAHWRFDEGGGPTAYDDTANDNDGALTNGAKFVSGKINKAIQFDGTNDYVDCGTSASLDLGTGSATIEAWFKTSANGALVTKRIGSGFQVYVLSNKFYADGAGTAGVSSVNNVNDGAWHHGAAVYDRTGSLLRLYVDGKADNTVTLGAITLTDAGNLNIGRKLLSGAGDYFNGLIDDVRIYNYARTAEQIMVDYNAGCAVRLGAGVDPFEGNPLISHWKFDENTGTVVIDRSGNGNDGTLSGETQTPAWTLGHFGSALRFDGNDYASIPSINLGSNFTIGFWMNLDQLYDYGDPMGEEGSFTFVTYADGHMFACIGNGSSWGNAINPGAGFFTTGKWYYVAMTYNSSQTELFVNGISKGTASNPGYSISTPFYIGSRQNSPYYFKGKIDDVKIYNYVRTQAQIAYDYNKGKPVSHYRFDEGRNSTLYDESDHDNDGALNLGSQGNITVSSAWAIGKFGYALSFDGTDDYMEADDDSSLDLTGQITVSAWVKPDFTSQNRRIVTKGQGTSSYYSYSITARDSGKFKTWFRGADNSWHELEGMTTYSSGTWYFITMSYDGSQLKLYVNGKEDNTPVSVSTAIQPTDGKLYIGQNGGEFFKGLIDDVRVYNYTRTAEQIMEDYNYGTAVRLGR